MRFVKGGEPRRIRFRVADGGPLLDASIYQIEPVEPAGGDDVIPPAPIALGYQVESTADPLPTVVDGVQQFDVCAYRVDFEGTTYQIVVSSAAARPLPPVE